MNKEEFLAVLTVAIIVIGFILGCMFGLPKYNVWASQMAGKARLAEANQSRQIKITEARAKKESAIYEAQAEVERAKGMAKANQIVGDYSASAGQRWLPE